MRLSLFVILCCIVAFIGCKKDIKEDCNLKGPVLENFISPEGNQIYIFEDGKAYFNENGTCKFILQYFDPNFLFNNYKIDATGKFIKTEGDLFPVKNNFTENMQTYSDFREMFLKSITDTNLYWNTFTIQSPAARSVNDYVALRSCILKNTCTFLDNKIELSSDPLDPSNKVLKFTSVAPSSNMVTAKASIESLICYYDKGSDLWFQSNYFIESGQPFSIVDFENSYFDERPGPRVVLRNNIISLENKFGSKKEYFQLSPIKVPANKWFTLKVHLKFSNTDNGIIELWQDGIKIISATGINLPSSNSIQNSIEVGITATSLSTVLLVDNILISDSSF